MSFVAEEIQIHLQEALRDRMPSALYEQWFAGSEVVSCTGEVVELGVKNRFFKGWIETRYASVLAEAAGAVVGEPVRVQVVVAPHLYGSFRKEQAKAEEEAAVFEPAPVFTAPAPVRRVEFGMDLNPDFTFDSFVVGSSNRLAHAVALRAAERAGEYDRVFFCGDHGVGKTHLMQAIAHEIRRSRPGAAVVYITGERFVADFVAAHSGGKVKEFRAGYRSCDVLVLDQLQVLGEGNKSATQAELLALVDELDAAGRQCFFAATDGPGELTGLDVRLRDRLGAGFVDRMTLPDDAMRRELLARKLRERGVELGGEGRTGLPSDLGGEGRRFAGGGSRLSAWIGV
ncbi:MAG: ATP-binding protein, partial [Planctomycetaceae bacterium]|nr:ATP-binding protein [Planctomycetaceae bacterium]